MTKNEKRMHEMLKICIPELVHQKLILELLDRIDKLENKKSSKK